MSEWNTVKTKVENYQTPAKVRQALRGQPAVFTVGITGAGKDAVARGIMNAHPDKYSRLVSYATRPPRVEHGKLEVSGEKYYFVTDADILPMLENSEFIEAKIVHHEVRGTALKDFLAVTKNSKIPIKDIDIQGAAEYQKLSDSIRAIFVLPPSFDIWFQRLDERHTEGHNQADLKKRLASAVREIEMALSNDFLHFLVNDDLAEAIKQADEIASGHYDQAKDSAARNTARELLHDIQAHLVQMHHPEDDEAEE